MALNLRQRSACLLLFLLRPHLHKTSEVRLISAISRPKKCWLALSGTKRIQLGSWHPVRKKVHNCSRPDCCEGRRCSGTVRASVPRADKDQSRSLVRDRGNCNCDQGHFQIVPWPVWVYYQRPLSALEVARQPRCEGVDGLDHWRVRSAHRKLSCSDDSFRRWILEWA